MGDGGEQCADDWEYMRIEVQVSGDRDECWLGRARW